MRDTVGARSWPKLAFVLLILSDCAVFLVSAVLSTSIACYRALVKEQNLVEALDVVESLKSELLDHEKNSMRKSRALLNIMEDLGLEKEKLTERTLEAETSRTEIQAQKSEIEQLLYTVSHDLKSPLVTIHGFATLVKESFESGDGIEAKQGCERIIRASGKMEALLSDLLQLSRIGRKYEPVECVDTSEVVAEVIELLDADLRSSQSTIIIETALPEVRTIKKRLAQLLQNLIGNALKHGCPSPGSQVRIGCQWQPESFHFYVRDDGPGIPREQHERIFRLFQRFTQKTQGTGIGLAIVTKVSRSLGGRVCVESEPGHGATFWLTLPKFLSPHIQGDQKQHHGERRIFV